MPNAEYRMSKVAFPSTLGVRHSTFSPLCVTRETAKPPSSPQDRMWADKSARVASVRPDLVRFYAEPFGNGGERVLLDPLHFALLDAGNRLRRHLGTEVFAAQASLLPQAAQG